MNNKSNVIKKGFTLAEVLIALGIIGVIAVLVIPTMLEKLNEKKWNTAANAFQFKLQENLQVMNTENQLTGYDSTEEFLDNFSKYMKIIKICDSNNLDKCFRSEFYDAEDTTLKSSDFNVARSFASGTWTTNTVGVQFADGVNALLAYNQNCNVNSYDNDANVLSCIAIVYDVNGTSVPNKISNDIRSINVNMGVIATIDGLKITKVITPYNHSPIDCTKTSSEDYKYCTSSHFNHDHYATIIKECGGIDNLPTEAELLKLAKYLYNNNSIPSDGTYNATIVPERYAELTNIGVTNQVFKIWSSEIYPDGTNKLSRNRYFAPNYTQRKYNGHNNLDGHYGLCVKH